MYNSQTTYNRIKDRAKQIDVSIKELNKVCSLSDNAISSAAKSQDGMKARNLCAISDCLDCSVDYLLGRTDNPQAHKSENVVYGDLSNNSGTFGNVNVGSTINNAAVDQQTAALLDTFSKLTPIEQAKVLVYADELINK